MPTFLPFEFFFFSSRRRHTRSLRDWSSDVCSSDLTTMELTAAGRPFLYFPLRLHFEQNRHVAHRLDRHGAGRRMDYATSGPSEIARSEERRVGKECRSRRWPYQ